MCVCVCVTSFVWMKTVYQNASVLPKYAAGQAPVWGDARCCLQGLTVHVSQSHPNNRLEKPPLKAVPGPGSLLQVVRAETRLPVGCGEEVTSEAPRQERWAGGPRRGPFSHQNSKARVVTRGKQSRPLPHTPAVTLLPTSTTRNAQRGLLREQWKYFLLFLPRK